VLPPAVPEHKLCCMLQRQRHALDMFLERLCRDFSEVISAALRRVARIALDTAGAHANGPR
jgi:hypothetical protein